jgi:hypothetical protein
MCNFTYSTFVEQHTMWLFPSIPQLQLTVAIRLRVRWICCLPEIRDGNISVMQQNVFLHMKYN